MKITTTSRFEHQTSAGQDVVNPATQNGVLLVPGASTTCWGSSSSSCSCWGAAVTPNDIRVWSTSTA